MTNESVNNETIEELRISTIDPNAPAKERKEFPGWLYGVLFVVFDIIGVAVTAADEKPFHSMASRKVPEAGDALKLIRNAGRVSSFCNDVIGDICGVISGSASATIAVRVWSMHPGMQELAVTLSMSALAAGLTVGGKACGKSFAIGSSTTVVRTAATILHFFHTIPEKLRPKRKR